MLDMNFIEQFYPENLKPFKRGMLREYLQYKVLGYIFETKFSNNLVFMGGTTTRIIYNNTRFSEDLDFDNKGMDKESFESLAGMLGKKLSLENYRTEIELTAGKVSHVYIKFPGILNDYGLSSNPREKLSIHIDAEPQGYSYIPDKKTLSKFDVFLRINTVPADVLLSQKICAIFMRKRPMGRDFYDVVFLSGMTKPSIDYLEKKLKISSAEGLRDRLLAVSASLDFKQLARDVEPFLFNPEDSKKVLYFKDFLNQVIF